MISNKTNKETIVYKTKKKVSMIRNNHNHKLQTTPWYREEEPHNNHKTSGRQTKQSNQLSLPHRDDCKTRMDTKKGTTKHRTNTESHTGRKNQLRINQNRTTALERTSANATRGLNAFYWYQIFSLDSAVVEAQKMLSSHEGEHSAILSTFIKLPFVIEIFVLSILSGRFSKVLLYVFKS